MALGRCDNCRSKLRFGTAQCERCGTRKNRWKYLLIAIIVVESGAIVSHLALPNDAMIHVASAHEASPDYDRAPPAGWYYYQTQDEMIGDTTRHARVLSRGGAAMALLGSRNSTGVLELRASPAYGRSVVVTLKRAALDTVADTCELRATFDTGDVAVFQASGSADSTNATLVLSDTRAFTSRLMTARTLTVDAVLSGKSERVAMFDVAGLRWQ